MQGRRSPIFPASMARLSADIILTALLLSASARGISVPSTPPSGAATVDPALVSVSIEFFAFPGYTEMAGTNNCLANLAALRGAQPAIRIGGTTQYVPVEWLGGMSCIYRLIGIAPPMIRIFKRLSTTP